LPIPLSSGETTWRGGPSSRHWCAPSGHRPHLSATPAHWSGHSNVQQYYPL